jgi:predicted PurR-regulated permease PerM
VAHDKSVEELVITGNRQAVPEERLVSFRTQSILRVVALLLALGAVLWILYVSRQVLSWIFVSLFLALALNPAVERLQRHRRIGRRGAAAGLIYAIAFAFLVGLGFLLIPPLADQISNLAGAAPGYVHDITKGRGPLGFLETKYHVVEKVRGALQGGAVASAAGGTVLSITRSVVSTVVGSVTIGFMTFFMILEGPAWLDRLYSLLPRESEPRWRSVGQRVAQTVSGYVTGNLLISVIAGAATAIVLAILGVPYVLALGLVVAILDLIPLAGATLAGILVVTVAGLASGLQAAIIVGVFFVVYQQIENHLLQPLVYGRTVQLSPLAVLIAVLIGAQVAGILGALSAIPVAGTAQILLVDWRDHRRAQAAAAAAAPGPELEPGPQPATS